MSDGDGIDVVPGAASVFQRTINDWHHGFKMRASGNFWDNTTVFSEDIDLGNDYVAQNVNAVFDNGGSGFVATGFNPQNFH